MAARPTNPQDRPRRGRPPVPQPLTPNPQPLIPTYLAIGHLTVDRLDGATRAGGSVAYAAATAVRLRVPAAIVTVAGGELDWGAVLPGVEIVLRRDRASTSFEMDYRGWQRSQRLRSLADPVPVEAVPPSWRSAPIVHLAPVVHEVSGAFPALFPGSLLALTPQGLLREWDRRGVVKQSRWVGDDRLLAKVGVVVLSEEDIAGDSSFLQRCREWVPVTVVTRAAHGAILYPKDQPPRRYPAFPTAEVDPTGAGDVFTAAFLIEYHATRDPNRACAFACCAASFCVEHPGLEGIPDRESVESRLSLYTRRTGE